MAWPAPNPQGSPLKASASTEWDNGTAPEWVEGFYYSLLLDQEMAVIPSAEIRKLQKDTELHLGVGDRERHAENSLTSVKKITLQIAEGIQLSCFSCFCDYLYLFL